MSTVSFKDLARALKALGIEVTDAAAPAPVKAKKAKSTFYSKVILARVPCAYAAKACASKRFAANGVGARQHTTCPKGRAALAAK